MRKTIEELIELLKDSNWRIRLKALKHLSETIDDRVVEPVIWALKDDDKNVRKQAVIILGQIMDSRAVEPLIAVLRNSELSIRLEAIKALGQIMDSRAIEPLIKALYIDENPKIRIAAANSLGFFSGPSVDDALDDALYDRNRKVRSAAVLANDEPSSGYIGAAEPGNRGRNETSDNRLKRLVSLSDELHLGQILFNPPHEMKVGFPERVEVRISKSLHDNLLDGLKGMGVPEIEKITVGSFMTAKLSGYNFNIKPLSRARQYIEMDEFTQWEWDITALKKGLQKLFLHVTVRVKLKTIGEEMKDYPVFERQINITANTVYTTKNFIRTHWKWIISTLIGSGVIGWIMKNWHKISGDFNNFFS
jgi:hypothetical protein